MFSEDKPSNDRVFERVNFNGLINTKIVITKEKKPKLKHSVNVPKWMLFIYGLVVTLLVIILLSSIFIVLKAPRPGLYSENCQSRSCEPKLNMKCINRTCSCTTDQYYLKGCKEKKGYTERCTHKDGCISNLKCLYGKCTCNTDDYWTGVTCTARKTYGDYCSDDSNCLASLYLFCYNGLCTCNSSRFWTGYACWKKNSFGQSCRFSSIECLNSDYISCINNTCLCNDTFYYYNTTSLMCHSKKNETEACLFDYQCLGDMLCLGTSPNKKCECSSTYYFDYTQLKCEPKTSLNTFCQSTNRTCRNDLGLICQSNSCVCNEALQFWYNSTIGCVNYYSYSESLCLSDSYCHPSSSLFCNNNPVAYQCDCPATSTIGMCDCYRVSGNESYWDSSSLTCKTAINEWQSCNSTYQCLTPMYCNSTSKLCQCLENYYYNATADDCLAKTLESTYCTNDSTCRTDLGLSCQLNTCKCNETIKFWYNSSIGCVNYFTYNEATCFSDSNCLPGSSLFCNLNTTTNQCSCPSASTIGMCDCIRVTRNESYWDSNSLTCKPAMNEWSTCNYTYQCMSDMYCNSTSKQCECVFTKYFDYTTYVCVPKTLNNTSCLSTNTCRSDLGLTCQSDFCRCNESIQFWSNSSNGCMNYFKYGELGCSSDSECLPGKSLFCNLNAAANPCNCNVTSVNGMCDCVRVNGNEFYWDNSADSCVAAKTYNSSCASNYECRTISEKTSCSSDICQCINGTLVGSLKSNGICGYCPSGWKLVQETCYQIFLMTACGTKNVDCVISKCNSFYFGSSAAILNSTTLVSTVASKFTSHSFASTGTYIGGYTNSTTWHWSNGLPFSTTDISTVCISSCTISTNGQDVCMIIEKSSSPSRILNDKCDSYTSIVCEYPF